LAKAAPIYCTALDIAFMAHPGVELTWAIMLRLAGHRYAWT
jgi:hypothetical protein